MKLPYGLFSFRAFIPCLSDKRIHLHRTILFERRKKIPALFWGIIQIFLALKWRWSIARDETDKVVNLYAAAIQESEGISVSDQANVVLSLAKRYCIHPHSIYQFRLYRNPERALDFIFPHETLPLHRLKNGTQNTADHFAMQDKCEFARRSITAGLPIVHIKKVLERNRNMKALDIDVSEGDGVFLKTRRGWRGWGAFSIENQHGKISAHLLEGGRRLDASQQIDGALRQLLNRDDVLVQPLLKNHSLFAKVAPSNQSVILRTITIQDRGGVSIYSAYLRIPLCSRGEAGAVRSPNTMEVLAGIDIETGKIFQQQYSSLALNRDAASRENSVFQILGKDAIVPFWHEIKQFSIAAQREYRSLWGVGWDWFVTQDRAFLLEGNTYWEAQKPQEVSGGLVEIACQNY